MMRAEYLETRSPTAGGPVSRLSVCRLLAIGAQLVGGLITAALVFELSDPTGERQYTSSTIRS
jgi:hypothetical protein